MAEQEQGSQVEERPTRKFLAGYRGARGFGRAFVYGPELTEEVILEWERILNENNRDQIAIQTITELEG